MNRIKHYALTIAALCGAQIFTVAQGNSTQPEADSNEVLNRVARIQQESQSQSKTPEFLKNPQISQWNNWSDWSDWNNWNNWYN